MFIFITSFTTSTLLLSFIANAAGQQAESPCQLPGSNENGTCITLVRCQYAINLLEKKDILNLRRLACGWRLREPLVCCPANDSNSLDNVIYLTPEPPAANRPQAISTRRVPTSSWPVPTTSRPLLTTSATRSTTTTPKRDSNSSISLPTTTASTNPDDIVIHDIFQATESVVEHAERVAHTEANDNQSISEPPHVGLLPNRKVCGTTAEVSDRIFGGEIAGIFEFPWIARIKYRTRNGREIYACGGSLISERYVLTAAHCVTSRYQIIGVRLGEWDTETSRDCFEDKCNDPPVDLQVESIVVHADFRPIDLTNDIALMRLDQPVNFTSFIRPICLPTTAYVSGQDYVLDMMYVTAGWGKTEISSNSTVLQKIYLKAVAMNICRAAIQQLSDYSEKLIICAGGRKGEDACQGDSGGPLIKAVTENYTNNWYLFGITSYGLSRCGTEGVPSIYTRVAPYYEWIISNMYP